MSERTSKVSECAADVLNKAYEFHAADDARKAGIYPYFKPFDFTTDPRP